MSDWKEDLLEAGKRAREAASVLALTDAAVKATALRNAAQALRDATPLILEANERDLTAAEERNLSDSMIDRLQLDPARIAAIATGVEAVARSDDPIGAVTASWSRPNGLQIERRRVPLGVLGIIFESRPNVTADAAALGLKSGNAVILRGGTDSFFSSRAILQVMVKAFTAAGLPEHVVQMVPTTDRAAVGLLLSGLEGSVDVIIPRGGRSLIERVQTDARVPVLGHLEGICHVYLDQSADGQMARSIVVNAKMRRTGICGAAETLLLDKTGTQDAQRDVLTALLEAGCQLRGDDYAQSLSPEVRSATMEDWGCEFLAPIMAVKGVDGVAGAIQHIQRYGSGHTESIVGDDPQAVERFLNDIDSAIVMHNASTQFADGGEFGMGAEIGIATGKLHARGPVGAEQLTSYKYVVHGTGQVRS